MQPQSGLQYLYAKSLNFLSAVADILEVAENSVGMWGVLAVQADKVDMVEMGTGSCPTYQLKVTSFGLKKLTCTWPFGALGWV